MQETQAILSVNNLTVSFRSGGKNARVVEGVSFELRRGEMLALVGESGSGKSVSSMAILRLLPEAISSVEDGEILFNGQDLRRLTDAAMQTIRGKHISMIFQEPMTALNPVMTVGTQVCEVLEQHEGLSSQDARKRCLELFSLVGIPAPEKRVDEYPHQLSGGMRQRVMIAMALACNPDVLIADEPTTALDVTVQAQIMELLDDLRRRLGTAVLFITHNLALVRETADRVAVMQKGRIVETGTTAEIFANPSHPYTRMLMDCVPRPSRRMESQACGSQESPMVLSVQNLKVHFPVKSGLFGRVTGAVRAVDDVSLELHAGETLALVGESGCGKTTVGKGLLRLVPTTGGSVRLGVGAEGVSVNAATSGELRHLRKRIQMIFQDPFSSLNPRMMVGETLAEGMAVHHIGANAAERSRMVQDLLEGVGLPADSASRYPHQFSGGQRQRIGLARALAVQPDIVICDECTSALDVSVQAQILALLRDFQKKRNLAYLFITHDLSVVSYFAQRVAVMYLGRIVETGTIDEVFSTPLHPYTQALLSAAPSIEDTGRGPRIRLTGEVPSPLNPPAGCHFHPRCPVAQEACSCISPELTHVAGSHWVACTRG